LPSLGKSFSALAILLEAAESCPEEAGDDVLQHLELPIMNQTFLFAGSCGQFRTVFTVRL
jgi:hypothetical protein